ESRLPGLAAWHRVVDYRLGRLRQLPNVSLYPASELTAADIADFGADHVVIATGARWTPALWQPSELPGGDLPGVPRIFTPDDIAAGATIEGPVAVFDFDNYYMGTAVALELAARGLEATYVTTAGAAQAWGVMTNEQPQVHVAFRAAGIGLRTLEHVTGFDGAEVTLAQIHTGETRRLAARSLVIVGMRAGGSALYDALGERGRGAGPGLILTGDANAPGAIAHAVWQGHLAGRDLGRSAVEVVPRRDGPLPSDIHLAAEAAQ